MKFNQNYSMFKFLLTIFCSLILIQHSCWAQDSEEENVFDQVNWQQGPVIVEMDDLAVITVPEGYAFANGADTRLLMESMGNPASNQEVGFLTPETLEWFVVFEFDEVGYIKDDEKDELDADAILESIRQGTEESNKVRREKGFSGLTLVGWEVEPLYNETTHNLEWAIRVQDDNGEFILNHNTRLLGRRGVMRATLVVDPQLLTDVLPVYRDKLTDFSFKSGQDYTSFIKGDKVASYGLAALVAGGAGVAAAKFGLFKVLAKFGKIIFFAGIAFFGVFWGKLKNLFTRKDQPQTKTILEKTVPTQSTKDEKNKE